MGDVLMVDSDGCNDALLPLWIEAGFTGFGPMEVQAHGTGPVGLRKRFGRELFLIGGIDKRVLARDQRAVRDEVLGKLPWMLDHGGGYIPMIDHAIPPDASYANYLYYRELVAECCGETRADAASASYACGPLAAGADAGTDPAASRATRARPGPRSR
jgi:uroporphyrinogen decarboxylase